MDDAIAKLFGLIQKDIPDATYKGDDLSMGSVVKYGVPTGIPELDLRLGQRGGYPAGKIIEFYGKPMCGKTTAAYQAAVEWQKRGGLVIFLDSEHSYDPERARQIGVNTADLIKIEVRTVEDIFESIKSTIAHLNTIGFDRPVLFIVDSVNGVPTKSDADGDLDDHERVGFEAKQIKRGVRQINAVLDQTPCQPTIIFINHAVTQIGKMFGKQTDSGGGLGIKFYASVRIEFAGFGFLTDKADDGARLGQKVAVDIVKLKGGNLTYPKFNLLLRNEDGFDKRDSLLSAMIATGFATKPKGSKVITILPGTAMEVQIKTTEWHEWLDQQEGGYDRAYLAWRKWAIERKLLKPWGGAA